LVDASGAYSGVARDQGATFAALADQWRRETGLHSSISKKVNHPAYQKIIKMGEAVLPYIFAELHERPGHWFAALEAITGASPVKSANATDMRGATEAWLQWGRKNGYVQDATLSTVR
jgi:hypothetical protein